MLTFNQTKLQLNVLNDLLDLPANAQYQVEFDNWSQGASEKELNEYLDRLMAAILNHYYHCGTKTWNPTRGSLNAMIIQCGHLAFVGGDLGVVPDWDISDIHHRMYILKGLKPDFDENREVISEITNCSSDGITVNKSFWNTMTSLQYWMNEFPGSTFDNVTKGDMSKCKRRMNDLLESFKICGIYKGE